MRPTLLALLLTLPLCAQDLSARAAELRTLLRGSPRLALRLTELPLQPPSPDWAVEMVSSVAIDRAGVIYLLQRGAKADPVIAVDR